MAITDAFPMKSGHGPQSYATNSSYQREGISTALPMLAKAMADNIIGIDQLSTWQPFCMADLGCSAGPNTFLVADSILRFMKTTYNRHGLPIPEVVVFFNDHATNDFNALFSSLPADRSYFAAGVPGSFHGRLFPAASLHLMHSSYTLHWLSQVPDKVKDPNGDVWNVRRIYYAGAPPAVVEAFSGQYARDLNRFLDARAEELVDGGLMAMIVLCRSGLSTEPDGSRLGRIFTLLGSTLLDLVAMGKVDGGKVDAFNLPIYTPSMEELEVMVRRNGKFRVERMQALLPEERVGRKFNGGSMSKHMRAIVEGVIISHFGSEIVDELFHRFTAKAEENARYLSHIQVAELFVLLKRDLTI